MSPTLHGLFGTRINHAFRPNYTGFQGLLHEAGGATGKGTSLTIPAIAPTLYVAARARAAAGY